MKKVLQIIMCLGVLLTIIPNNVDATTKNYLALGDSITSGYLLADPADQRFTTIIGAKNGYTINNQAIAGYTSKNIYDQISTGSLDEEIKNAELITITMGGNELLDTLYTAIANNVGGGTTAQDIKTSLALGQTTYITNALAVLPTFSTSTDFQNSLKEYENNLEKIINKIRTLNKTATVIIPTQYNPYYLFNGTFSKTINDGINAGIIKLNEVINNNSESLNYIVADVYSAFNSTTTSHVNASFDETNPLAPSFNLDFHPNKAGHELIANTIIDVLDNKLPVLTLSSNTITLENVTEGYSVIPTQIIKVTNTGENTVTLLAPRTTNFKILLEKNILAKGESTNITILANPNLAVGQYNETVILQGSSNTTTSFTINLTVNAKAENTQTIVDNVNTKSEIPPAPNTSDNIRIHFIIVFISFITLGIITFIKKYQTNIE